MHRLEKGRGSTELFGDESMGEIDGWSGSHLDGEKE